MRTYALEKQNLYAPNAPLYGSKEIIRVSIKTT